MMIRSLMPLAAIVLALTTCQLRAQQPAASLENCIPSTEALARKVWMPMYDSPKPEFARVEGANATRFPCNFSTSTSERASWDQTIKLDLSNASGIEFKVMCPNAEPVMHFSIFFQSDRGWYTASFFPERTDRWNTIRLEKSDFVLENSPSGWEKLQTLRISAWKGGSKDTDFFIKDLRATGRLGEDSFVAVLKGHAPAQGRSEDPAGRISKMLQEAGLRNVQLFETNLSVAQLQKAKLLVLPQRGDLSQSAANAIQQYVAKGGKVLGFYTIPESLRSALNLGPSKGVRAPSEGAFSKMRAQQNALPGIPTEMAQTSEWITSLTPVPGKSRTVAEWVDSKGQATGHGAIVASSNCVWVSTLPYLSDRAAGKQFLAAIAGSLVQQLWQEPVQQQIAAVGQFGRFDNFDQLRTYVSGLTKKKPEARAALAEATRLRNDALKSFKAKQYAKAMEQSMQAGKKMELAFCCAHDSEPGEFRAFWCHSAFGVRGFTWDEAIANLSANGFTAILPNMLWGGAAFHPSEYLPAGRGMEGKGDQVKECLEACRKHGIQMHVWKVNWYLGSSAPSEFLVKMRNEGRLQASASGQEKDWLCPSHPANKQLEIDAMVELARNYPIDGVHFDYIRYPDNDHCYCNRCREKFAQATGVKVANWPADLKGADRDKWNQWRRDNITEVVKAVSEKARAVRPGIKISAAVFPDWTNDRNSVAQDWKLWLEKGYLDFACPMDYADSDRRFENLVKRQKEWAAGKPYYPGIGLSTSPASFGAAGVIEQILITRKYKTGGFVIFNYGTPEAQNTVPLLGKGVTSKPGHVTTNR